MVICEHKINGGCVSETCYNSKPRTRLTCDCFCSTKDPISVEVFSDPVTGKLITDKSKK
jgi:hypothetical protein